MTLGSAAPPSAAIEWASRLSAEHMSHESQRECWAPCGHARCAAGSELPAVCDLFSSFAKDGRLNRGGLTKLHVHTYANSSSAHIW